MSLFPAYTPEHQKDGAKAVGERTEIIELVPSEDSDVEAASVAVAVTEEASLLASDSSGDEVAPPAKVARLASPLPLNEDFYVDGKRDPGNLGVTTLYYPGRPIYTRPSVAALGAAGGAGGASGAGGGTARRYYLHPAEGGGGGGGAAADAAEVAARARAYRDMLARNPADQELWLRYIHFQEACGSGAEWICSCEEGVRSAGGARLRSALHRARRAHRDPGDLLKDITSDIAREKDASVRLEQWVRLVGAVAAAAGGVTDAQQAARAALADAPCDGRAYPQLLYAYGCGLRAAGLWEQLVLLIELVCAMNCPPCAAFPPHVPPGERAAREQRLLDAEDKVVGSGLPLSAVWVRVEKLRAAAHWRGDADGDGGGDPQRVPSPADVAALLCAVRPERALHVAAALLRLAQVPLLPMSESAVRACGGEGEGGEGEVLGAGLLALSRAARRLPPAHPARGPGLAARLPALLDPPHYFTDDYGFLTWTEGLWEACLGWVRGRPRLALVCWRLRWLHALARLVAGGEECRRLRARARRVFKQHAAGEPVAAALYARIESDVGRAEDARRAAAQAVRTAAGDASVPREHALFCARVLRSVAPRDSALWRTALCCAALRRAMPPPAALAAPSEDTVRDARDTCSRMCDELERRFATDAEADTEIEALGAALSVGAGEWGAARVALLSAGECREELRRILALPYAHIHQSVQSVQYFEQSAAALAEALGELTSAAPALRPLFPNNGLVALACAGRVTAAAVGGAGPAAPPSPSARLAQVLPALLQASFEYADEDVVGVRRVARRCGPEGGAGGAALCALRLEAEARSGAPPARLHRLLYAALADLPNHKWVYVRGAEWVPREADALCDAALERGLRAHALLHELRPAPTPAPPPPRTSNSEGGGAT